MMRTRITTLAVALTITLATAGTMVALGPLSTPESAPMLTSARAGGTATAATSTTEPDRRPADTRRTVADEPPEPSTPPNRDPSDADPTDRSVPADDADIAPPSPVREAMAGAGGPPPAKAADPIGDLDDERPVPAGLDLTAPPKPTGSPNDHVGPTDLAVEASCSHQCISRGVAYPRGFGAELVVETTVPATLFLTVVADLDGNGTYEDLHVESTPYAVSDHAWALDHLEPGQAYHVMAAATDANAHTAYVWGAFTTLSQRAVFLEFGNGEIIGGPNNISRTDWYLGFNGPPTYVDPGDQGILYHQAVPRYVDIDFWVARSWDEKVCEAWFGPEGYGAHGHGSCIAWNSTQLDAVDLDLAPAGRTRWAETSVALTLHPPTGAGDALPPGYGDPYYFFFEVPLTLHVIYS